MKTNYTKKESIIKNSSSLILIVILTFTLGCKQSDIKQTDNENVKKIVITMIAKSSANPIFESAKVGAEKTAKQLSEKYSKIEVVIDWKTPKNESASEQSELIHNAVKDGAKGIIVSCSDEDTLTEAINYAVENGVEVMTFDSDAPKSKRFAFYGPDNFEIGVRLLNELAPLINAKGEVAILGGNQMANNLQERIKGIKSAAKNYPEIKIIGEFYHLETEEDAIKIFNEVNKLHPNIKGWIMVGSWALFGEKLKEVISPNKLKIVAVDALPVQLKYIEQYYVHVLLGQPTFSWGEVSVKTMIDKIYFNKKVDEIIKLKIIPVTIDNLGGWARQLKSWGYENIPRKYFEM